MSRTLFFAFATALYAACTLASSAPATPDAPAPQREAPAGLSTQRLIDELRSGGYVLYFRHTSTDFSQDDSKSRSFDDCANQRNLTDRGRDEARAIGKALRALKIPIGTVYASPYCRTMETARLVFGKAQAMNEVRGGPIPPDDPNRYRCSSNC